MGMPDIEELSDGPPIRVCASCLKSDDTHLGGKPTDISPPTAKGQWVTCHRCRRRSRIGYLVDRRPEERL